MSKVYKSGTITAKFLYIVGRCYLIIGEVSCQAIAVKVYAQDHSTSGENLGSGSLDGRQLAV